MSNSIKRVLVTALKIIILIPFAIAYGISEYSRVSKWENQ